MHLPMILRLGGLFVLALTLSGQQSGPIQKQGRHWVQTVEGSIPAGTRLRVSSTGNITVSGQQGGPVRYRALKKIKARNEQEARRLLESASLSAALQGETAAVTLATPDCFRCNFLAEMTLLVPKSTREALLTTEGGSLTVEGIEGRVNADTAGGSIRMDKIGGDVRAATAGGSIMLGTIGGTVRAETAGGSIRLEHGGDDATLETSGGGITAGEVEGSLVAETSGGGIRVDRVGGSVMAGTAGGSIRLGQVGGTVSAETAGGSIHVDSAPDGVRAETAGGSIRLINVAGAVRAASAAGGIHAVFLAGRPLKDSFLETNVGSIVVVIPATLALTVEAAVDFAKRANRIQSDFEAIRVSMQEAAFGGGIRARGQLNGGGPVLRIRNTNGTIQIRRAAQK